MPQNDKITPAEPSRDDEKAPSTAYERYAATEKGKAARAAAVARYQASEKGKAARAAAVARYQASEKGKEARRRASQMRAEKRAAASGRTYVPTAQRILKAELRRVDRLIEIGFFENQTAEQKAAWIEQAKAINAPLYQALIEKGVV